MVHLALYVIEDFDDAISAIRSDVFDFTVNDTECENCGMMIGPLGEDFLPCVVIVDTDRDLIDDRWSICLDCAAPLLYPNEWIINLDL